MASADNKPIKIEVLGNGDPVKVEAYGNKLVLNPDGTVFRGKEQIWPAPVVATIAAAAILSAGPVKAYTLDMLYAAMSSIPERVLTKLELQPGYCEDIYKVTREDGWMELMDAKNQPGSYNYLLPKQGIPAEGSIDALVVQEKERDENNGVTLPPKALVPREAKNIIYNGSSQSKAARNSLGRTWYWLPSSPDNNLARVFHSDDGNENDTYRLSSYRARLSRSIPPSPQGVGG